MIGSDQFMRMAADILDLIHHYPSTGDGVCDLLNSAMKSFINLPVSHVAAIVESAIQISRSETAISLRLISGLVSNVEKGRVTAVLPIVSPFFAEVDPTENVVELVHFCVSKAHRPIDAIHFVAQIPCAASLSDELFREVLGSKDLEELRVLLEKWPLEDFLSTAFLELGVAQFSEVRPPLPAELAPVLFYFLEEIQSPATVVNLRKVLNAVLVKHDETLEYLLVRVIQHAPYEAEVVLALFAASFEFLTSELLATVVAILDPPFDVLVAFLDRARSVASSVRLWRLEGRDRCRGPARALGGRV
jgi:hypothetical protein